MPLSKDLREFVELLNSNGVEYLVVGGFAVSYHGFARYTGEDFLVRPSEENSRRVLAALAQFGFGSVGIHAEDFRSPDKVVQLGVPPNSSKRSPILTSLPRRARHDRNGSNDASGARCGLMTGGVYLCA
jgi:hypothetical protein